MMWRDFYLVCFLTGFLLSLVSFVAGTGRLHVRLPRARGMRIGASRTAAGKVRAGRGEVAPVNFATFSAFLCWFGGTGYLLANFAGLWQWLALTCAIAGGLAGAALVFWFLVKVLLPQDRALDAADYRMIGVLGRVTSQIREGGTGEIAFKQGGTRRSTPARSEDRSSIPQGAEVIVTQYEKGIAYVRRWEDLTS
jgi:membrane protein implicated in regulation of membrane protease activity